MATEMPSSPGLVISATESIISFLSIAAKDLHLSEELQQTALNLLRQPNVPYMPLRTIWIASDPNTRPDLIQLFSGTQFAFPSPKPREKSEELKARLKKLEELAEKKAYQELVKDIAPKKDVEEPFSSYKDQLGIACCAYHVYWLAFGYVAFRALFNHNPAMNAAGGILGLVVGMLVETFLFIIRSSNAERNRMRSSTTANITKRFSKSSVGASNLKKNQ